MSIPSQQFFATPQTGSHLSALRRCVLQPWQRRDSDARRTTRSTTLLARISAAARACGRGKSSPAGRAASSSSLVMGAVLGMVWEDFGQLGRMIAWGTLAEVPLRRRRGLAGLCDDCMVEVRLKIRSEDVFW